MQSIEYFYSTHSGFAYIGSKRFMEIARAAGRRIVHRPVDLGRVIAAAGGLTFHERTSPHRNYFFGREIERWAEVRDVPVISWRPTFHDNPLALSSGMVIAAIEQGEDADTLAHAILEAHWRDDADIADPESLEAIGQSIGLDPAPLLEAASSQEIQAVFEANTAEAISRSVFGSPTYFVDGDMFYGQDHLDFVERAMQQPFKGTAWLDAETA